MVDWEQIGLGWREINGIGRGSTEPHLEEGQQKAWKALGGEAGWVQRRRARR